MTLRACQDDAAPSPQRGVLTPRAARLWGAAVALAVALLMIGTERRLAIVWDEGFTLARLARVRAWFGALADPPRFAATWRPSQLGPKLYDRLRPPYAAEINTRAGLFSRRALAWFWPFAREEPHGHPSFYALLGLLGDVLTPWRDELARARLGAILLFSATAGAVFAFLARRCGVWAASVGAGAFSLQPQLFALGHYAHYDGPLTCLWVASILAFCNALAPHGDGARRARWGWAAGFGALVGCAAGTKLTGWFLPLPFLAWAALRRDRAAGWVCAVGGVVALITVYAVVPPWWANPVWGPIEFFRSNLTRGESRPLPVAFLGHVYLSPAESLPWYNTLVWTALATPIGFLLFAAFGAASAVRRPSDEFATLAVGHWLFLLVLRALPHAPGHDGVRQLLPAFGCLALVAGAGAGWAANRLGRWGRSAAIAALAEGVVSVALSLPYPLCYFSPLVGGLPGAARLGMEPTYYWDTLTDETLAWINAHTEPGRTILFSTTPRSYFYLKRSGRLRPAAAHLEPEAEWQWYILQHRPGFMTALDHALVAREGPPHVIASQWGVPLVWAFPRTDYDAVASALAQTAASSRTRGDATNDGRATPPQ